VTLRVGFLGAGFIARYHAFQLRLATVPHRIEVVHDLDHARAASFVGSEGGRVASSVDEVVTDADAVFVCTWTADHLDAVRAVAAAGTPVFCEKPLSTDIDGAAELADVVRSSGVPAAVGLVLRTAPALLAVRELLAEPDHGRVMNVVFRDDQYLPTQGMYESSWRSDRALAGSGTLLEHSIHDVDLLEWLLGPAGSVAATTAGFHGLDGIEDSVTATFQFPGGASAALVSVWHDVLSRPSQRRIEIFRERALITVEGELFGPVRVTTTDAEQVLDGDDLVAWLEARSVPLSSTEQDFLEAARAHRDGEDTRPVRPDVDDALRAHVVVDAMYRSAAAGGVPLRVDPGA